MAASGSFNTTAYEGRYLQFSWSIPEGGQSISGNNTKINWTLKGAGAAQAGYYLSGNFKVVIDGTTVYQSATRIQLRDGTVVASGSVTLAHNGDGTRSFSASAEAGIFYTDVNCRGSGSWSLPTIARASDISYAGNVDLGNNCNIKWTPKHKDFAYVLKFTMGNWSYITNVITPKTTAEYTYTGYPIPLEAAYQIPNSKTGTMTAELYSYTDSTCSTQIGSASTGSFTVTVPKSAGPKVIMHLSPVTPLSDEFSSIYVQRMSKVQADFTGSEGKYGATIASYVFTVGGYKFNAPYLSNWLFLSGQIEAKVIATDSRGHSTEEIQYINVIPYDDPAVVPYAGEKSIICARCDANGALDSSGTYLRIKAARKYSKVETDGEQKNFCALGYRYAVSGAEFPAEFSTLISKSGTAPDDIDTYLNLGLAVTNSYVVQLCVEDEVGQKSIITVAVPTEEVTFMLKPGGKGAAFGKYAEADNLLDVAWDARVRGDLYLGDGDEAVADFVTELGTKTVEGFTWRYRKCHSGRIDMWCRQEIESGAFSGEGNLYYSGVISLQLPFEIQSSYSQGFVSLQSSGITWAATVATWSDALKFNVGRMYGGTDSLVLGAQIYVTGVLAEI